jgi:hypothetical protein
MEPDPQLSHLNENRWEFGCNEDTFLRKLQVFYHFSILSDFHSFDDQGKARVALLTQPNFITSHIGQVGLTLLKKSFIQPCRYCCENYLFKRSQWLPSTKQNMDQPDQIVNLTILNPREMCQTSFAQTPFSVRESWRASIFEKKISQLPQNLWEGSKSYLHELFSFIDFTSNLRIRMTMNASR